MSVRILLYIIILLLLSSCRTEQGKTLILAHGLDTKHSVHIAMEYMAEQVEELSNGQLSIRVYPSQQLGTERQCLELLQIGSVDITKVSSGVLEAFNPVYKVFSIPYIFRDRQHAYQVMDSDIGTKILASGQNFWLRGLCFYDSGSRSFYSKNKPILSPADLKGQKIRVLSSPTSIEMIKLMGGAATPISWGELYTALQGGVVDGAENNPPSFYLSHHYEVCGYYSLNEHTILPDVVLISTLTWDKLNDDEKKWLTEAVKRSVAFQRDLWIQSENESLKAVIEAGVEVIYPDKEPFIQSVKPLREAYRKDPLLRDIIQQIEDIQAETDPIL